MIYAVNFDGTLALVNARSPQSAHKFAREWFGLQHSPYEVEQATEEEIAWSEAMGGIIHEAGDQK